MQELIVFHICNLFQVPPLALKWPGLKKGKVLKSKPMIYKNIKIYTSMSAGAWRVLPEGKVVDTPFKWGDKPKEAWQKMLKHLKIKGFR